MYSPSNHLDNIQELLGKWLWRFLALCKRLIYVACQLSWVLCRCLAYPAMLAAFPNTREGERVAPFPGPSTRSCCCFALLAFQQNIWHYWFSLSICQNPLNSSPVKKKEIASWRPFWMAGVLRWQHMCDAQHIHQKESVHVWKLAYFRQSLILWGS